MKQNNKSIYRPLGDFIIQRREKNKNYDVPIYGVSREGFIPPKQKDADISKYNVFYRNDFVFNPARMELNSIAFNDICDKAICSSLYEVFYVDNTEELLPEYLNLFVKRNEFARLCDYVGNGSSREYCRVPQISLIKIPVPLIEVQRKIVALWQGTRNLKLQNEGLVSPLMNLCKSYLQELKKKYKTVAIGEYIEEVDERNTNGKFGMSDVRGLATSKQIIDTKAKLEGVSLSSYKILKHNEFAYVSDTSRRGDKMSLGYNRDETTYLVSSISTVFKIKDENKLLPSYLFLQFNRPEFDRFARFHSWGISREVFSWEDMCRITIPLPPIKIQEAIVKIHNCADVANTIAKESNDLLKIIGPALVQRAINE